jgi:acyl carrier protein
MTADTNPGALAERAPEKDMPDRVAAIFSEVFGMPGLGRAAEFFDLGGDSLLAETLMAAIEREFGIKLPTSILLDSSTPEELSKRLGGEYRSRRDDVSCLAPIRAEGTGTALFWVHGMTGYFEVAEELGKGVLAGRPIYGFRALGLRRDEVPLPSIPKIAEHYIGLMREVQPEGPYLLGGQCPTGFIAMEMARQLVASGDEIAGVVLIDPYPPIPWLLTNSATGLMKERLRLQEQYAAQMKRLPAGGYLTQAARDEFVFDIMRIVTGLYTPKQLDAPVLLVCAEHSAPHLLSQTTGLPSVLPRLETVRIGQKHLDAFREELPATGAAIGSFLDRIAPR